MASTSTGAVAGSVTGASQLPATGSGGPAPASASISALLLMSVAAITAGMVAALLGRQRALEDDGIILE